MIPVGINIQCVSLSHSLPIVNPGYIWDWVSDGTAVEGSYGTLFNGLISRSDCNARCNCKSNKLPLDNNKMLKTSHARSPETINNTEIIKITLYLPVWDEEYSQMI